jgi:hypothetical protein
MNQLTRFAVSLLLVFAFIANALPCGPAYLTPIFEYKHAPENPFANFAAGRLGIVKPSYNRSVLFAAYRYLNGGGFSAGEQKALVEVWEAEFANKTYEDDDISESVKAWIAKRKEVVGKEETPPEIYVERNYGGYDFFPNCTKNAFEVATETLSSRITSYGSDDKDVKEWISAQDKVFVNCASGKQIPEAADPSRPEWLQKDRAYQIAAAEFYSLDEGAKRHFLEIALDDASPWKETADYLVGRTLIRQASLTKDEARADLFYAEAEQNLALTASRSNNYSDSAIRLLGLVKYRLRPKERVRELAHNLSFGGNEDFRQNLIDYKWLLDKFEKEELEKAEKRKEEEKIKLAGNSNAAVNGNVDVDTLVNEKSDEIKEAPHDEGDLLINLYIEPRSFSFYVKPDASDAEVIAAAENVVGQPLTENQKKQVRDNRQSAYSSRFTDNRRSEYPGRYYGLEETSLSILPAFLREDDLTDWLFTYQIENTEAYLYSLSKFRQTSAEIWLMTAISKADKNSAELGYLLEAAGRTNRSGPAYPTIAYNMARIRLEQGKTAEARKLLDEILNSPGDLPISSRNQFLELRLKLSESLDEFITFSLRKPFAFDFDGQSGTIDEFIAEQKSWFDPENEPTKTREENDREIEENWKFEKEWQDRQLLDSGTVEVINNHFPLSLLIQAERSPALPDYLRSKFAIPILTRALMLGDTVTLRKIAPDIIHDHPQFEGQITAILTAKTPAGVHNASLFMILKNPVLSPYIEDGLGKTDNELNMWDGNDWWCTPYDTEFDEASGSEVPRTIAKPMFLTAAQSQAAQAERKKLKDFGDAPMYLGKKVLEWAKRSPLDKRVPESLYIVYEANGWTKYGCGNNEELKNEIAGVLKRRYPQSEWTQKVLELEKEQ